MIIIGYQGIGKSTLAKHHPHIVDLESNNFFIKDEATEQKVRDKNWYIPYCNIAENLSKQKKIVCVSSHKEVRERLKNSTEMVISCVPDFSLKDEWIKKLRDRYESTKSMKDYKAWKNANDHYLENITDIMNDATYTILIKNIQYNLKELIDIYTHGYLSCNYF